MILALFLCFSGCSIYRPHSLEDVSISERVRTKEDSGILVSVAVLSARADQVINTDLIVDGRECMGDDCADGESFGLAQLKLKHNNTRLKFEDTSTSSICPKNDM